jgi:hypothetical protein
LEVLTVETLEEEQVNQEHVEQEEVQEEEVSSCGVELILLLVVLLILYGDSSLCLLVGGICLYIYIFLVRYIA